MRGGERRQRGAVRNGDFKRTVSAALAMLMRKVSTQRLRQRLHPWRASPPFSIFVSFMCEQQVMLGKPDSTPEVTVTAKSREAAELQMFCL